MVLSLRRRGHPKSLIVNTVPRITAEAVLLYSSDIVAIMFDVKRLVSSLLLSLRLGESSCFALCSGKELAFELLVASGAVRY